MSIATPQVPALDCSRGAPMGRTEWPTAGRFSSDLDTSRTECFIKPARCFRLRFVDGCYDEGGAYWGSPADVYCATNGFEGDNTFQAFCRAKSREEAKAKFAERIPGVRWVN